MKITQIYFFGIKDLRRLENMVATKVLIKKWFIEIQKIKKKNCYSLSITNMSIGYRKYQVFNNITIINNKSVTKPLCHFDLIQLKQATQ